MCIGSSARSDDGTLLARTRVRCRVALFLPLQPSRSSSPLRVFRAAIERRESDKGEALEMPPGRAQKTSEAAPDERCPNCAERPGERLHNHPHAFVDPMPHAFAPIPCVGPIACADPMTCVSIPCADPTACAGPIDLRRSLLPISSLVPARHFAPIPAADSITFADPMHGSQDRRRSHGLRASHARTLSHAPTP